MISKLQNCSTLESLYNAVLFSGGSGKARVPHVADFFLYTYFENAEFRNEINISRRQYVSSPALRSEH